MTYKVTFVVSLSTVITQKVHGVSGCKMFRVVAREFLHTIPQSRDSVNVLIQTKHKTVFLVVLLHVSERIKGNVTEQLDAGLNPPVELVVLQQRMTEEKSRLIAAHVTIALRVSVNDFLLSHLLPGLLCLLLVNPFGVRPVFLRDDPIVRISRDERRGEFLKIIVKFLVIQKDPVIVVVAVEAVLDLPDRPCHVPDIFIASQRHKCGIHAAVRGSSASTFQARLWR